jgi:hypothetical protein
MHRDNFRGRQVELGSKYDVIGKAHDDADVGLDALELTREGQPPATKS